MKRIIALIITLVFILSLSACGGPTPTETVDSFLTAVKAQDAEAIKECYAGDEFIIIDELDEFSAEDNEFSKMLDEILIPKVIDFEYKLDNEKVDGDKATVDVTISTYNFGSAFTSFLTDYMTQAFALAFSDSDNTDEQLEKISETLFKSKFESVEKNYSKTVTVSLTKKDNKWTVDKFKEGGEFYNALLGDMIESLKTFEETYE